MLSVGLIQYTYNDILRSELIYTSLNALSGHIHDNCLSFLELIYYHKTKSPYASAIYTILMNRKGSIEEMNKIETTIQRRNGDIMKLIDKVMKFKTGSKFFGAVSKTNKEKQIRSTLAKVLAEINEANIDLKLFRESINSISTILPRTVVRLGTSPLPIVKSPFLPPLKEEGYTLVLDLDETLVHYCDVFSLLTHREGYQENYLLDLELKSF